MDSLSFHIVRPMNRLTQKALLKHFNRHSEKLTSFNAKLIQRYALLDYVDHRAMLTLLTEKAQQPLTPASFAGLRQTLQAVQRFPRDFDEEKRRFESIFLQSVLNTPPDTLSSVEYSALWSLTTLLTAWEDVLRLSSTFPLQKTLPLQSEKEFRVVLDQMLVKAIPISSSSSSYSTMTTTTTTTRIIDEPPRGIQLLKELVGEDVALQRALDGIMQRNAQWTDREAAVSTFIGVVHALERWPQQQIPGVEVWRKLALRPTTFHDVDFHQLLRILVRVHSPAVPEYVRMSLDEAICSDLWRCYSELPNEPVAVFFEQEELLQKFTVTMRKRQPGNGESNVTNNSQDKVKDKDNINSSSSSGENNSDDSHKRNGTPEKELTVQLRETMRELHERTLEKQLRSDGPPLTLPVIINLFIGSVFLRAQGELTGAIISALKNTLISSSSSSVAKSNLTTLQAVIIATCLDRMQQQQESSSSSSSSSSEESTSYYQSSLSAQARKDADVIGTLLLSLLTYPYLQQHGSARCVSRLLCECPQWTRRNGLEETCFHLLREHAQDGFTKAQLQTILDNHTRGYISLPVDVKEIIVQRAAEVPSR
ncbi:uncharacterized protein TM35_000111520 [Trypanosoma theileri]|uniref:Uncharacterized protein n=1 Tax=Trypanosoma theileri TaxID=67003 RepID=A0A1X0NYJ0_9TRYP|nr:uncharacterized protein TM35_000111520 [Trypanosoma theileri]ORC89618.1 hypothetical protein TM35_000111520 [Trypanosoma theileri]